LSKDQEYYNQILSNHLAFIERQTLRALRIYKSDFLSGMPINDENEALTLFNNVIDKLRNRDFYVLKKFKGKSQLKYYLSAIISKEAVDLIRKKRGKNRFKEKAKKLGELAMGVHKYYFTMGLPVEEAFKKIQKDGQVEATYDDVVLMVKKLKTKAGKEKLTVDRFSVLQNGFFNGEEKHLVAVDDKSNPEQSLIHSTSREKVQEALQNIVTGLDPEERLLLRLRFPSGENETPLDISTIAKILTLKEKSTYTRIRRLLIKCREQMEQMGISAEDYFFEEKK